MIEPWMVYGFLAGVFQAFRVAAQRLISLPVLDGQRPPSVWASPLARVVAGIPVACAVLLWLFHSHPTGAGEAFAAAPAAFWWWTAATAGMQIGATILQTNLVKRRHFALGIMYVKIMLPAQAAFGWLLFGAEFSRLEILSVSLATLGVMVMSLARVDGRGLAWDLPSMLIGLGAGLMLAFAGLFAREAVLTLPVADIGQTRAGVMVLVAMIVMQFVVCAWAIAWRDAREFSDLWRRRRLLAFVGIVSIAGSMCWFIGFAYAQPALVNTAGQSEFLIAMLLAVYLFHEKPSRHELAGMLLTFLGIVLLVH